MRTLENYIEYQSVLELIEEDNKIINEPNKQKGLFYLSIGNHGEIRRKYKFITNEYLIDVVNTAYPQIEKLYKDNKIVSEIEDKDNYTNINIADYRIDTLENTFYETNIKKNPLVISVMIKNPLPPLEYDERKINNRTLSKPLFTIKTIFLRVTKKMDDFAILGREKNNRMEKNEILIKLHDEDDEDDFQNIRFRIRNI